MQPLDLLQPAPASTNNIEPSSPRDPQRQPAPDGEFGRLMERAMSPDQNSRDNPESPPRKGKTTTTPAKSHVNKAQPARDTTGVNTSGQPDNVDNHGKAKKATNQPDGSPAATKETITTDATTSPATPVDDTNPALPVLSSLPMMEHPGTDNTGAKETVLQVDLLAVQSITATGTVAALPTIGSSPAVTGTGGSPAVALTPDKFVAKTTSDKSKAGISLAGNNISPVEDQKKSTNTVIPTALPTGTKTTQPLTDTSMVLPPTGVTSNTVEPVKAEKPTAGHMADSDLAANATAQTEDKFQAFSSVAAKLTESSKNDGTGVAITASSMKNSDKTNKVAGLDVQVLPGGTNSTARETVLPAHATVTAVRSSEKQGSDFNLPLPSANPTPVDATETSNIVALPSLADARMRDVERTHDLVSIHALRMVDAKSDSLQVIIKPGAGTELSLELRQRNGSVEAEATLQRGDFQLMNQHWPELQAKLEQRGIKLAPLGGEINFSATGNSNPGAGNFSRQQSSREEAAQQASAFAEFTVAMNRGGATARLAPVTGGGWESWA